jgi:hypothetical protein
MIVTQEKIAVRRQPVGATVADPANRDELTGSDCRDNGRTGRFEIAAALRSERAGRDVRSTYRFGHHRFRNGCVRTRERCGEMLVGSLGGQDRRPVAVARARYPVANNNYVPWTALRALFGRNARILIRRVAQAPIRQRTEVGRFGCDSRANAAAAPVAISIFFLTTAWTTARRAGRELGRVEWRSVGFAKTISGIGDGATYGTTPEGDVK